MTPVRGAFARYARHMLEGGYSPIPIRPGTKRPFVRAWDRLRSVPLSPGEIGLLAARYPDLGLGVAGGYRGLVPVDIDAEAPEIIDAICSALPAAAVAKAGRRGFAAFYRDDTGLLSGRKFATPLPERAMLVEILATGKSMLPPTTHPDTGKPYRWLTDATLFNTRVEELPEITPAHIRALELALRHWVPERPVYQQPVDSGEREAVSDKRLDAYARTVLAGEVRVLEAVPKNGGRNHQLFHAACKIGKYVHHGVLPLADVETALMSACRHNGLLVDDGLRACQATLASGLRKSQHDNLPALSARGDRRRAA